MEKRNMKKTWELSQVEIDHVIISDEEYQQLVDEWAEVVYCHLRQLKEKQAEASVQSLPTMVGRIGTDG